MPKKILFIVLLIAFVVLVSIIVIKFYPANNDHKMVSNVYQPVLSTNSQNKISSSQNEGELGGHTCLSFFQVKAREPQGITEPEVLKLDSFQSFITGAFSGKINNFQPGQNKLFAALINQLMQEQKITTYFHLEAKVCLYHQDLYNPTNGATLNYYIEHYYCTNHCQTGKYEIKVDLDEDGNFVGYRQGNNIY
jgi:hypothetical protein